MGFGILTMIHIWSLVFDTPMFQILAVCLDFEGTKKINVIEVLIWGFGGCWRLLTEGWHLYFDLDMVTGLSYTHVSNFCSPSWFWRCKEQPCPLSPHLGLWRLLEVPDWGWHLDLALDMVTDLWYTTDPNFSFLSSFWGCKEHPCPFRSWFGALEDAGGS